MLTPSHEWHVAELATGVAAVSAQSLPVWWATVPPEVRAVLAIFVLQVLRALAARAGLKFNGSTQEKQ